MSRSSLETHLAHPGAESQVFGLILGSGTQRFDMHTLQEHLAPNTKSDLLFKSALAGQARAAYTGLIRVSKVAQKIDAYQANRNLLLSLGARADSIPKLEILADDVRCSHGATVGPVEEDQCFYLMSRGLSRGEAERLIVEGFFEQVLEKVSLPLLQDTFRAFVTREWFEGVRAEKN